MFRFRNLKKRRFILNLFYEHLLKRKPSEDEFLHYVRRKENLADIFLEFIQSEEYKIKHQASTPFADNSTYAHKLYKYILNREPSEEETLNFKENCRSPEMLLDDLYYSEEADLYRRFNTSSGITALIGLTRNAPGLENKLNVDNLLMWYAKAAELSLNVQPTSCKIQDRIPTPPLSKTDPVITIITSVYDGEDYIRSFMDNIIKQTIFDQCELFILDAASPGNEQEIINDYRVSYPNIRYERMDRRIGIYEAWNFIIKNSSAPFLTNLNIDDVLADDAMELRYNVMKSKPNVDVVYSDIYYSFLPNLPFHIISECGFVTNLPEITVENLLQFNAPHNSPFWRRTLHEKIGYFDESFISSADFDFWLRATLAGAEFYKMDRPVVSYYSNPKGMSTRQNTPGISEAIRIKETYTKHLAQDPK